MFRVNYASLRFFVLRIKSVNAMKQANNAINPPPKPYSGVSMNGLNGVDVGVLVVDGVGVLVDGSVVVKMLIEPDVEPPVPQLTEVPPSVSLDPEASPAAVMLCDKPLLRATRPKTTTSNATRNIIKRL